jgi:hypothetical protein
VPNERMKEMEGRRRSPEERELNCGSINIPQ